MIRLVIVTNLRTGHKFNILKDDLRHLFDVCFFDEQSRCWFTVHHRIVLDGPTAEAIAAQIQTFSIAEKARFKVIRLGPSE